MRVPLFLRERRPSLDALGGIRNGAVERGPSGPEAERRYHQARVAEHRLRLDQSLAFHTTDQPVGIDVNIGEREGCRVAEADAVLVFRLVMLEAGRAFLNHEPTGTAGRVRQYGVSVGDSAV